MSEGRCKNKMHKAQGILGRLGGLRVVVLLLLGCGREMMVVVVVSGGGSEWE
jgi:hypothetical protein